MRFNAQNMGLGRIVQMLKTSKEFDFVYKNSYKFRSEMLDICVLKPNLAGQFYEKFRKIPCSLVGFSVSKKVGNAVERNLIKRRLRAICREFFSVGNSPLELHSADSANFGRSQTISLVSRPKFAENYESQTENPSVVDLLHESVTNQAQNYNNPSLLDSTQRVESWQSTESANNSRDSTNAPRGSIFDEKSGLRSHERGNRTNGSLTKRVASLPDLSQKDKRANLICIFIAKRQILQTPFIALKSTIFTTLKKQLNFRQGSYKKPRTSSPHNAQNRISQNHTKGTL